MTDLEQRLADLRDHLDVPDHDLAATVARRLREDASATPRWRPRRATAIVAAVLALGAGAVGAPAVADWLSERIGGVEVRKESAPVTIDSAMLRLGERITAAEAASRSGLTVPRPRALGAPDEVWINTINGIPVVSAVYHPSPRLPATPAGVGALVQAFRAGLETGPVITKFAGEDAVVERVTVQGAPGLWLEGSHGIGLTTDTGGVTYEENRLAASALVWERDGVTFRLESKLHRSTAIAIAETIG